MALCFKSGSVNERWLHTYQACVVATFTWWIYEFHIFELRDEEINAKAIIAVKCATYTAKKKTAWKHFEACRDSDTELCDTDRCSALTNLASKPTKSRSLNWLVIDPGKIKTKWRICEFHIFELRDEEIIAKKIITVNYVTYAVAERKSEKSCLLGFEPRPLRYTVRGLQSLIFLSISFPERAVAYPLSSSPRAVNLANEVNRNLTTLKIADGRLPYDSKTHCLLTVEPQCVTTSRKLPSPLSDYLSKTPNVFQSKPLSWSLS